jgi:vitamin-K-epoxide reductase (warfarin-sensitive)
MSAAMSEDRRTPQSDTKSASLMAAIALVASLGIVVSSVSLRHHFGTSTTSFCDFGQSFNCDIVNRSAYSTVLGVPVALIGILGYLMILALSTIYRTKAETPVLLAIATGIGLLFSLYLTYVEKVLLATWCILCLTSLALILTATVLSIVVVSRATQRD